MNGGPGTVWGPRALAALQEPFAGSQPQPAAGSGGSVGGDVQLDTGHPRFPRTSWSAGEDEDRVGGGCWRTS